MKIIVSTIICWLCIQFSANISAQITEGVITFERKTNMIKKSDGKVLGRLKFSESNKYVLTNFVLYFTDSISIFTPSSSNEVAVSGFGGRGGSQATSLVTSNTVYQNFPQQYRYAIIPVLNEEFYLEDSLKKIDWKITDDKRMISGYECRKAVVYFTPTTRIYAWYSDEIIPTVGPESFWGLPGAILGLATEDGGVTYFATKVETINPATHLIQPKANKNKLNQKALSEKLNQLKVQNVMIDVQLNDLFIF